jgi:glycosyltransferase involved in cell wall biosynthesis
MARHLGSASIFAAPARYEPFGLAILEAAAAGCALVLGDIPSLRENWDGAAAFVPPEDRVALGATINLLIADAQERTRLAAAARRRAGRFTLRRMAQSYATLYCEMARSSILLESV